MDKQQRLFVEAKHAISTMYSNTEVPKERTISDLKELRDEIFILLDALENS